MQKKKPGKVNQKFDPIPSDVILKDRGYVEQMKMYCTRWGDVEKTYCVMTDRPHWRWKKLGSVTVIVFTSVVDSMTVSAFLSKLAKLHVAPSYLILLTFNEVYVRSEVIVT